MGDAALLVTAFEPFGGATVNASWEAARRIDGWRSGDAVVRAQKLSCVYEACVAEFVAAFRRLRPRAVLLTGEAARRGVVSVERFARNAASPTARDNRGALGLCDPAGPNRIAATAPAGAVARAIRDAGVAARVSTDAGDYVCNHLYYGALRHLIGASPPAAAIFVHLPVPPDPSRPGANARGLQTDDAVRALKAAIAVLLEKGASARD